MRSGVGFADLTGFTALSERTPLPELAALLAAFDESTTDVVHSGGGRVVKFLGDAVMFVAVSPDALVAIAHALVHDLAARGMGSSCGPRSPPGRWWRRRVTGTARR